MTPEGSPEPLEVSGSAPCQTDMDCSERVKTNVTDGSLKQC